MGVFSVFEYTPGPCTLLQGRKVSHNYSNATSLFLENKKFLFPCDTNRFLYLNDYMTEKLISLTSSVFTVSTLTIPSVITQEDRPGRA